MLLMSFTNSDVCLTAIILHSSMFGNWSAYHQLVNDYDMALIMCVIRHQTLLCFSSCVNMFNTLFVFSFQPTVYLGTEGCWALPSRGRAMIKDTEWLSDKLRGRMEACYWRALPGLGKYWCHESVSHPCFMPELAMLHQVSEKPFCIE